MKIKNGNEISQYFNFQNKVVNDNKDIFFENIIYEIDKSYEVS